MACTHSMGWFKVVAKDSTPFQRSVDRQIAMNHTRTPTQRMEALCDLLDVARAMAPPDEPARQRRHRALAARHHEREQWREQCRRFLTAHPLSNTPVFGPPTTSTRC
jgi:hypothetical protein